MLIRDLFLSDVTRDIPPVVYFHEQSPDKLQAEVSEYIITGGWPKDHPNFRRVPNGIHEQYVHLLTQIAAELDKKGGTDLPNVWISGFYGSGKSSFAKLLGLALDGTPLPNGSSLASAWLARDTSPKAAELRAAWDTLRQKIDPLAVVFDIGGIARDNEHVHATALRQVQRRLNYCSTDPLVADFELRLERDGHWADFDKTARNVLGKPWSEVKDKALAEEDFSLVLSVLFPERYTDPMSWYTSRAGTHTRSDSPEEAARAIRDMLQFRRPHATLFLVIDEVSQYVVTHKDRTDRLRAFATALGSTLRGKAWLFALGQQKIDEGAEEHFLVWAKDRFPPKLRVHLAATNIRDVVHKRLLQKRPDAEPQLRTLFERHRPDLKLYAFGCESVTTEEFIEVYPLLPGQIDLILKITTALRTRSSRAQGDDQAIRGLLQLLGELFRNQKLADQPVGALVTVDQIYEVQYTALDSDIQTSMARIFHQCKDDASGLLVRAAKAVAMLELVHEDHPTDAQLVAQCLYDRIDRGNQVQQVTQALEELHRRNLLAYSAKSGYKIQSSAGEEWERERRDIHVARETRGEVIQEGLKFLVTAPERPKLRERPFPLGASFSDGRLADDVTLVSTHDPAAVRFDFRYLSRDERDGGTWVKRSAESALVNRIVWVSGDNDNVDHVAGEFCRSQAMVKKYQPRRESLTPARQTLLQSEQRRSEELERQLRETIADTWMAGKIYFRGFSLAPKEQGTAFSTALVASANRVLPDLFPYFITTIVEPKELAQLVEPELSAPSTRFLAHELGILEMESGRYVATCSGVVPRRIQEFIESEGGISGALLVSRFGGPPYGYPVSVIKACAAGLLRGAKVRVQPESGNEITAVRDAGVRELIDKDGPFKKATWFPAGEDEIGPQGRARICKFFADRLGETLDREDDKIADAVAKHFPVLNQTLRTVHHRLNQLPGSPEGPPEFRKLADALEQGVRLVRQTKAVVKRVKKDLEILNDGVQLLRLYDAELTPEALRAVTCARAVLDYQAQQLHDLGLLATNVDLAAARVAKHLATERPWRDIAALDPDLMEIRNAYIAERGRLLQWQEHEAETARARVKLRDGFTTLTADQSHRVLRPIAASVTNTSAEAIAPGLPALKEPFQLALRRAEEQANEILDEILSEGSKPLVTPVDLRLRNRELVTEADVMALMEEIKQSLLERIRAGARVRLL